MSPNPASSPDDDPALRETLKRCSPATYYAACKFRKSARSEDLRLVVLGVIERFVDREMRPKLSGACDTLRLREDLALDSLTMMEIVMIAEEVLAISVSNEELIHLSTVGDVHRFLATKVAAPTIRSAPSDVEEWNVAALGADLRRIEAAASSAHLGNKSPA